MKQHVIALVGPDKCGKTEIGNKLSEVLGIPLFKAKSEKKKFREGEDFINEMRYSDFRMFDFLEQTGHSVILDRAWPCEWVYSQAFERATDESATLASDSSAAALGAKIIICYRTSYEGLVDEDAPDKLRQPMLEKLHMLYEDFAAVTKCRCMFLNVDDENLEREIDDILRFLEEEH